MRGKQAYKVSVGYGEKVFNSYNVNILYAGFDIMRAIKAKLQSKYGSLAWVKWEKVSNETAN